MPTRDESLGQVDISSTAVATIANQAINQSYGVVGMASKNVVDGIARLLTRDSRRGIEVTVEERGDRDRRLCDHRARDADSRGRGEYPAYGQVPCREVCWACRYAR